MKRWAVAIACARKRIEGEDLIVDAHVTLKLVEADSKQGAISCAQEAIECSYPATDGFFSHTFVISEIPSDWQLSK